MNWEAWKPLATLVFTTMLKFVGGALVAHGLATNGPGLEALGGAATTAAGALWSWWVQKGHIAAGNWLKHLTDTATQAAAIEVARRMPSAALTGTAVSAKAEVKAIEPAVMAKDAAATVVKILLVAFVLSAFLAVPSAQAQAQTRRPTLTGNLPADIKSNFEKTTGVKATGDVPFDLLKALDKALLPDLQYAQKLAIATGSKVTAPCYGAWIDMINTQQTAVEIKNADGTTTESPVPDPHLVTSFERMVELRNALQPDSAFMTACSPVANMVKLDVTQFMGIVISGGAGLATLVPGL